MGPWEFTHILPQLKVPKHQAEAYPPPNPGQEHGPQPYRAHRMRAFMILSGSLTRSSTLKLPLRHRVTPNYLPASPNASGSRVYEKTFFLNISIKSSCHKNRRHSVDYCFISASLHGCQWRGNQDTTTQQFLASDGRTDWTKEHSVSKPRWSRASLVFHHTLSTLLGS